MDLGSGGGFPGLVIGISKPKNKICLVETSRKKAYFLKKTINTLKLKNIEVINKTLIQKNNLGSFDYITTRAFANIKKQIREINKTKKQNNKQIPPNIKYGEIHGLSNEVKEKLAKTQPQTIGAASQIEGVTPAAINLILIHLKKKEIVSQNA